MRTETLLRKMPNPDSNKLEHDCMSVDESRKFHSSRTSYSKIIMQFRDQTSPIMHELVQYIANLMTRLSETTMLTLNIQRAQRKVAPEAEYQFHHKFLDDFRYLPSNHQLFYSEQHITNYSKITTDKFKSSQLFNQSIYSTRIHKTR